MPDRKEFERSNGPTSVVRTHQPLPTLAGDDGGAGDIGARVVALLSGLGDAGALVSGGADLAVTAVAETPLGQFVQLRQSVGGVPIFGSSISVQVTDDVVTRIASGGLGDPAANDVRVGDAAPMGAEEAVARVRADLAGSELRGDALTEQVYVRADAGLVLSWRVVQTTLNPGHEWEYLVDASSGAILSRDDILRTANATGMVFDPNPVVTANNTTLRDSTPEATLNAQRVSVTLRDVTLSGGVYSLTGPFVRIVERDAPNAAPPTSATPTFNFNRNEDGFEAVCVYYHIDTLQRYIQDTLGITNACNFSIPADVHDNLSGGGGFYSPSGIYMGLGDSGPTQPDRGEDADSYVHEYGHAIQANILPGWGVFNVTTQRQEARAMGEGFGDALACIWFHEKGGMFQPWVFEDWCFAHQGGLRRVDGSKRYPGEGTTGTLGDWAGEEHDDGEIWSAALWQGYLAAGGSASTAAARAATRKDVLSTMILHHFKLTTNATMPQAAEAMLETNCELPKVCGRQARELLDAFHDRNILRVAPGADLWIKDNPPDPGNEASAQPFWDSPDLWVRHADDSVAVHQDPESGQDNWIYARVRNRGTTTARAFVVTFQVKTWLGTQFVYPNDFVPYICAAVGFNLAPGAETIVRARWPRAEVPAAGVHGCLLASVYTPTDEAAAGRHVWEANNLAQKNLRIVNMLPDTSMDVDFRIGHPFLALGGKYRIEIVRPANRPGLAVSLAHPLTQVPIELFHSVAQPERPVEVRPVEIAPVTAPVEAVNVGKAALAPVLGRPRLTLLEGARVLFDAGANGDQGLELRLAPGTELTPSGGAVAPTISGDAPVQDDTFLDRSATLEADASGTLIKFNPGIRAGFPVLLPSRFSPVVRLRVTAPADAKPGETIDVDVVQRDAAGVAIGGIRVRMNIVG